MANEVTDELEQIILSAETHGIEGDDPDHEVGDLQGALRLAWRHLTRAARRRVTREFFATHLDGASDDSREAGSRCVACGEEMQAGHEVHVNAHGRAREFCSLDCADAPRGDWNIDRFDAPIARYPGKFSIWPDGTVQRPEGRYDLEADERGGDTAAQAILDARPARGPCGGPGCEASLGGCRGWAIFDSGDGAKIERIDQCGLFSTDDEAIESAVAFFDAHFECPQLSHVKGSEDT